MSRSPSNNSNDESEVELNRRKPSFKRKRSQFSSSSYRPPTSSPKYQDAQKLSSEEEEIYPRKRNRIPKQPYRDLESSPIASNSVPSTTSHKQAKSFNKTLEARTQNKNISSQNPVSSSSDDEYPVPSQLISPSHGQNSSFPPSINLFSPHPINPTQQTASLPSSLLAEPAQTQPLPKETHLKRKRATSISDSNSSIALSSSHGSDPTFNPHSKGKKRLLKPKKRIPPRNKPPDKF
jgi:hypothetical protein